jgi:hypothetical protein
LSKGGSDKGDYNNLYLVLTSIINWTIQAAYVVDMESYDKVNYAFIVMLCNKTPTSKL